MIKDYKKSYHMKSYNNKGKQKTHRKKSHRKKSHRKKSHLKKSHLKKSHRKKSHRKKYYQKGGSQDGDIDTVKLKSDYAIATQQVEELSAQKADMDEKIQKNPTLLFSDQEFEGEYDENARQLRTARDQVVALEQQTLAFNLRKREEQRDRGQMKVRVAEVAPGEVGVSALDLFMKETWTERMRNSCEIVNPNPSMKCYSWDNLDKDKMGERLMQLIRKNNIQETAYGTQ